MFGSVEDYKKKDSKTDYAFESIIYTAYLTAELLFCGYRLLCH